MLSFSFCMYVEFVFLCSQDRRRGELKERQALDQGAFCFPFHFPTITVQSNGRICIQLTKEENISLLSSAHSTSRSPSTAFQLHPPYLTSKLQDKTHLHVSSNLTSHFPPKILRRSQSCPLRTLSLLPSFTFTNHTHH